MIIQDMHTKRVGKEKMEKTNQKDITLVVDNEESLYSAFSPEAEFSEPVKAYIRSKAAGENHGGSIRLTVVSREHLDEERFRSAVSNWIRDEKVLFRRTEKETVLMLIGLLIFGSILLVLSLALEERVEVLKYSLLPIMGSLSLGNAARIMIIEMPTIRAKRWMIGEMEKDSVITFDYTE